MPKASSVLLNLFDEVNGSSKQSANGRALDAEVPLNAIISRNHIHISLVLPLG